MGLVCYGRLMKKFKVVYHDLDGRTEFYDSHEQALGDIQQVTLIATRHNSVPKIDIFELQTGSYQPWSPSIFRVLTPEQRTQRLSLPSADKQPYVKECSVCKSSDIKWVDPAKIALIDKELWLNQKKALPVERLLNGVAWVCLHCNQVEILVR